MKTNKSIAFLCLFITASISTKNADAKEDLKLLCEKRIEILQTDMPKVLRTARYSLKYRSDVKKAIKDINLKPAIFEQKIAALRVLLRQDPEEGTPYINCLFQANDLMYDLAAIAGAGNKNLDAFSSRWQKEFQGVVKYFGYGVR